MIEKSTPACVGIIMDGNRRWARAHTLADFEGHAEGYKKLKEIGKWVRDAGIPHAVAYAFSTENWQRYEKEVGYLMKLFRTVLETETEQMIDERIRIRFIGDRSLFSADVQLLMEKMESATASNFSVTIHLLMSYGGRAEIVSAARAFAANPEAITEESFGQKLWSHPMPDPDLIIRTGGEKRLSNFLPWQSVYSELFFTDTFWPDFSKEEFDSILSEFVTRERRRGK